MSFTFIKRFFGCYPLKVPSTEPYKLDDPAPNVQDAESERKLYVPRTAHRLLSEHFQTLSTNTYRMADEFHSLEDLDLMETSEVAEHSANARKNRYGEYGFERLSYGELRGK